MTERSTNQVNEYVEWERVACSNVYSLAIKTDGTLWGWGYNIYGQLGTGDTTNYSSPVQVGSLNNW